jgi:hypothetical protein
VRTQSLRKSAVRVNQKRNPQSIKLATQLIPVLVRREGHEGIYHIPVCDICHEPITDFESANIVVKGWKPASESQPLESLGSVGDTEFFKMPGVAIAVHFKCDQHKWTPWIRLSSVFRLDQRSSIEKLGFAVGL